MATFPTVRNPIWQDVIDVSFAAPARPVRQFAPPLLQRCECASCASSRRVIISPFVVFVRMPSTAELTSLTAVSPVDGRYGNTTAPLREHFSEYALIKHRVIVEVEWLLALAREGVVPELPPFDEASIALLQSIASGFDVAEAQKVKAIEKTTNHDVKAVEYWI